MKEKSDADVVASASTPTPDPTAAGSLMDGITFIHKKIERNIDFSSHEHRYEQ